MKERERLNKKSKSFKCPLCGSLLSEVNYYKIIGIWDEKVKAEERIRKELEEAKRQKKLLIEQLNLEKKKLAREKALAIKEGIEKGKQKERARATKLAKLVEIKSAELQNAQKKIKELERHLREGTTPQTAGLDFEKEIIKQLQKEFPNDKIEHHGKNGDILQKVIIKTKQIGSILYEVKKTSKYNSQYVDQTKRAVAERNATYGVLVTTAMKKNSQGFFVEKDIIVVHPYGTIHIAQILRSALIEMFELKLSNKEIEERSKKLMNYIKSDEFKNLIDNVIYRTQELAKMLIAEHKEHNRIWRKRMEHYKNIYDNTNMVKISTKNILTGTTINRSLIKNEIKQLPSPKLEIK